MSQKTKLKLMECNRKGETLAKEMENYYKIYKHRKPCKEWVENRWCEHYIKARAEKFRKRINGQINEMLKLSKLLRR